MKLTARSTRTLVAVLSVASLRCSLPSHGQTTQNRKSRTSQTFKHPVQQVSRAAVGDAVGSAFGRKAGFGLAGHASHGSAIKAVHGNTSALAVAAIVGEEICK